MSMSHSNFKPVIDLVKQVPCDSQRKGIVTLVQGNSLAHLQSREELQQNNKIDSIMTHIYMRVVSQTNVESFGFPNEL
jgi:hypothetical protein